MLRWLKNYSRVVNAVIRIDGEKYALPLGWRDVTVGQFQRLETIRNEENALLKSKLLLSELLNCDIDIISEIPLDYLEELSPLLEWTGTEPNFADADRIVTINGKEYGLIPEFNEMPIGLWLDLDHYCKSPEQIFENLHIIFALLYRPVVKNWKQSIMYMLKSKANSYHIEKYDSKTVFKRAELFQKELSINMVLGAFFFFRLFAMKYSQFTADFQKDSKSRRAKMKQLSRKNLIRQISLAGLEFLNFLQKETSPNSMQFQSSL
jgi:hypothetical protein